MLMFKELHSAFVSLGGRPAPESAEILAPSGPGISLARIKPVLARLQFPDHSGESSLT
jgi:hypothetical protein